MEKEIKARRKGAKSRDLVPADILAALNRGELETVNLVEWLAADQVALAEHLLRQTNRTAYLPALRAALAALPKPTVNTRNACIGQVTVAEAAANGDAEWLPFLQSHRSDMARGWACYGWVAQAGGDLEQALAALRPLAADSHFGVREVAWMAARPLVAEQVMLAIALLTPWVTDPNPYIRRFAAELTRPRGVWCAHIAELKAEPALGLPLLSPLYADPDKYVRDSVANWLNDAAKTNPDFVRQLCAEWAAASASPATAYIVKRAQRTLKGD
jgi:3-methyladenine DNA glycosylase AlkC